MSSVELKIKEPLCSIIKDKGFDGFTVTQLMNVFLKVLGKKFTEKEARILVYKQILRLLKRGLLSKSTTSKGTRDVTYSKTSLFNETAIIPNGVYVKTDQKNLYEDKFIDSTKESTNNDRVNNLKQEIKEDKVDLLSSISESEEYLRLIKTFPQEKEYLQNKNFETSERSSKLIGKIRAAKNTLHHLSEE